VAEVSCPTKYFTDASSINFFRSVKYGLGCLQTATAFSLAKMKIITSKIFPEIVANYSALKNNNIRSK
jgi:hypothetical protein